MVRRAPCSTKASRDARCLDAIPIGRRIRVSESGPWLTIVGVVADLKYSQLDAAAEPEVYVPYSRIGDGLFGLTALVMTATDPAAVTATTAETATLAPRIRQIMADIDRTQAPNELMVLACCIPALRAALVDPTIALRSD